MTWDMILPESFSSTALFLLLACCALPTATLTAIVLWRNRRYVLAIGVYIMGMVTVFNGLVAYGYTPNRIASRLESSPYTLAERWALANYAVMVLLTLLAVILTVTLVRASISLGLLWVGVVMVEAYVGTMYGHYQVALRALAHGKPLPHRADGLAAAFWLGLAGVFMLAAFLAWLRGTVPMAVIRRIPIRDSRTSHNMPDHVDFVPQRYLLQSFMQQQMRLPNGTYLPVPYGIRRWRQSQKRWRRALWQERRKIWCAIFLFGLQFYGPPMPPDYRYYELHEFY